MTKETALYNSLKPLAVDWVDVFGYWAPLALTDSERDYAAVRETAALVDFSMLRKVEITGTGALELVNRVVARDVSGLREGKIAYGPLCNEDGKMVDDCTVMVASNAGDHVWLCGANDRDFEIFRDLAPNGVQVSERTEDLAHICLQGPHSRAVLASVTESDVSGDAFPYYTFREDIQVSGVPAFITRLGYTAELGYEIWVAAERAAEVWDTLVEAGKPHAMKPIGVAVFDPVRLEGGFIIGGVEYDDTVSPYECGLGWAVALEKGEFLGRAGLARDRTETTQRLASVVLESGGDSATGALIHHAGEAVGHVTQSAESPAVGGKTVALARIREDLCTPETAVQVKVDGGEIPAKVVHHPVYDPERIRVRS